MSGGTDAPARSGARQLAETLDTIGLLVASMSDRIDMQTRGLEKIHQTVTEARMAAFAAQRATDWEANGDAIRVSLEQALISPMARLRQVDDVLDRSHALMGKTAGIFEAVRGQEAYHKEKAERRRPWILIGSALGLVLLTLLALHVVGRWTPVCGLLGGRHGYFTADGIEVCAFRQW